MGVDLDRSYVGIVGQDRRLRSRSNNKNRFLTSLLPCLKVKVRGRGQGQRSWSRSWVNVKSKGQISGAQQSILAVRLCSKDQKESLPAKGVCLLVSNHGVYTY